MRIAMLAASACALLATMAPPAAAQQCYEPGAYMPLIGNPGQPAGTCLEVEVLQGWVFALRTEPAPRALAIWNINDPAAPVQEAVIPLPEGAHHLRARDQRLYFASPDGYDAYLNIWDVADPRVPVPLGTLFVDSQVLDLEVAGDLAAICTPHFGVSFIDVSDPAAPVLLSDIDPVDGAIEVHDVELFEHHAVCAYRGWYFGIAEISTLDPAAPVVTGTWDTDLWLRGFVMESDGVHGWASDSDLGLFRVDLDAPGPVLTRAGAGGVRTAVFDDLVITHGEWGLMPRVHRRGADGRLTLQDCWPLRTYDIARKAGYLVAAVGSSGLHVRQLTPDATPPFAGATATARAPYPANGVGPTDTPGFVLELNGDQGRLGLVDATDPEHPVLQGAYACSGPRSAAARGEDAVVGHEDGVDLLRLTPDGRLEFRARLRSDTDVYSVLWDGDLLWLGSGSSNLWLYDMADPDAPVLLYDGQLVGSLRHLFRLGDHLVVGAFLSGLYVLDVTEPASPVTVAHLDEVPAEVMSVAGAHAYLGHRFADAVTTVSLADPAAPVVVDTRSLDDTPQALLADGEFLWVATGARVEVFPLASGLPAALPCDRLVMGTAGGMAPVGGAPAVGADLVYVLRRPCPTTTAVTQTPAPATLHVRAAPNPFNPRTTVSLDVAHGGRARLAVYDLRGRLVRVLRDGVVDAGRVDAVWNGRDAAGREAPAGVYLLRAEWAGATASAKLALVR